MPYTTMATKTCTSCSSSKSLDDFYTQTKPNGRVKVDSKCKVCRRGINNNWKANNKEHIKEYDATYEVEKRVQTTSPVLRKEHVILTTKSCATCQESKQIDDFYCTRDRYDRVVYDKHCKECKKALNDVWRVNNPEKVKQNRTKYRNRPEEKIRACIGHRILYTIQKNDSTSSYLGASMKFAREWLEFAMVENKTGWGWEDHGSLWHIDHVLPISIFDHTIEEDKLICWNWKNISPLGRIENLVKSNKVSRVYIDKQVGLLRTFVIKGHSELHDEVESYIISYFTKLDELLK